MISVKLLRNKYTTSFQNSKFYICHFYIIRTRGVYREMVDKVTTLAGKSDGKSPKIE